MGERLHGTAIAVGAHAILLRGPSGAGKSDLALRLVLGGPYSAAKGRTIALIADDQVLLEAADGRLLAHAPEPLKGLIEVRGIGIVAVPGVLSGTVRLLLDLVARERVERMPEKGAQVTIAGVGIPHVQLDAFDASAPLKILIALDAATRPAGGA